MLLTVGGTIPADDIPELKELGVAEVFTPGRLDAGHHRLHPGRGTPAWRALTRVRRDGRGGLRSGPTGYRLTRQSTWYDPHASFCQRRPPSEDLRPRERGAGRGGPEADRPVDRPHGPRRREEPQPVRHARDRGRDAGRGGRCRRGRRDRRRHDGPVERGPRAAQGGLARRRPLRPPVRRRARRLRRRRDRATRWREDARARVARPRPARPAVATTASATRSAPSWPTT